MKSVELFKEVLDVLEFSLFYDPFIFESVFDLRIELKYTHDLKRVKRQENLSFYPDFLLFLQIAVKSINLLLIENELKFRDIEFLPHLPLYKVEIFLKLEILLQFEH